MTHTGASVLDALLGELAPGRLYLLTGGPASGKTALALQFLAEGLGRTQPVALLTSALPDDVKAFARQLGLDVNAALRAHRLLMLRYRPALARQLGHVTAIERVVDDLRELLRAARPARIAIDSFTPFLADSAAAGLGITLLAECLEATGATSMLTFPERLEDTYDRRLEPIVQRAAALLHLRRRGSAFEVDVVPRRAAPPAQRLLLAIQPGRGVVAAPEQTPGDDTIADHSPRPLLLVHTTPEPADELVALLDRGHQVIIESADALARADYLARGEFGAVLVETDHKTLQMAQRLVARLSAEPAVSPLVALVRFNIRSLDRARLLAAGADEVLTGEMGPDEFVQRLRAVVRRGHTSSSPTPMADGPALTHAMISGGERRALNADEMARVIGALVGADDVVPCAIVTLSLAEAAAVQGSAALAELAMHAMRFATGDFAMAADDRVMICLMGAQRRGAGAFVDRVRERWTSAQRAALRADVLVLPADVARARALLPPVEV